jgi:hypothetical protein
MATGRQNFTVPAVTKEQLEALAAVERFRGNQSEVMREAVDWLWRRQFQPESIAPDAVLEKVSRQLRLALATLEGEIERRAELADRQDDE